MTTEKERRYQREWKRNNRAKCNKYKRDDLVKHNTKRRAARRKHWLHSKALGSVRKWELRSKYNLSLEEYQALLDKQNGVCAICKTTNWGTRNGKAIAPSVDHCHKTGKVRGILCLRCNKSIGAFGDDIALLEVALTYLRNLA